MAGIQGPTLYSSQPIRRRQEVGSRMNQETQQAEEQQSDSYQAARGLVAEMLDRIQIGLCEHYWVVLGVNAPFKPAMPFASAQTNVLVRCTRCQLPQALTLVGHWQEEQLIGKALDGNTTTDPA